MDPLTNAIRSTKINRFFEKYGHEEETRKGLVRILRIPLITIALSFYNGMIKSFV